VPDLYRQVAPVDSEVKPDDRTVLDDISRSDQSPLGLDQDP
jgi:hypothetical protein